MRNFLILCLLLVGSCSDDVVRARATIGEIRVLIGDSVKGNSGAASALLGGMVMGATGAVVGGLLGHENQTVISGVVKACRITAIYKNEQWEFDSAASYRNTCALLRHGDTIDVWDRNGRGLVWVIGRHRILGRRL
jgi:hypothetical protein